MRIGRVNGRLAIINESRSLDVERVSAGRFGPNPDAIFAHWDAFTDWANRVDVAAGEEHDEAALQAPTLTPAQVFAIGLNYANHAKESGVSTPTAPPVFTKFPSCLTGPTSPVELPSDGVDWEVELVVVIGREATHVREERGWAHVAGLMVGQDLSERAIQLAGPVPQFSLGKSFPGFGPVGPTLVTADELADPDDLVLRCEVDGEILQQGRTRDMIFSVPELVARLSAVCTLQPGDLIFTGTPDGVGMGRTPKRYLQAGTTLVSTIEGIGQLRNPLIAGPGYHGAGREHGAA
jgi:2,4-diketo-3-deoxy-L-fuconate hydrolase